MNNHKFFRCAHCGNLVGLINNAGVPLVCCGENMQELIANTTEASTEKHIPVVTIAGDAVTVKIGSVAHPMTAEHHIEFIYLLTENGGQMKRLKVEGEPAASFKLADDTGIEAYAYCNLHGLWKAEISR